MQENSIAAVRADGERVATDVKKLKRVHGNLLDALPQWRATAECTRPTAAELCATILPEKATEVSAYAELPPRVRKLLARQFVPSVQTAIHGSVPMTTDTATPARKLASAVPMPYASKPIRVVKVKPLYRL